MPYKIIIVGNSLSGKTAWLNRLSGLEYIRTETTIGTQFSIFTILFDRKELRFEVWDIAGHERYLSLYPMFVKDADVVMIFVNLSRDISEKVDIMNYVESIVSCETSEKPIRKILIGNHLDHVQPLNSQFMKTIANQLQLPYVEMSVVDDNHFKSFVDILNETSLFTDILLEDDEIVTIKESNDVIQLNQMKDHHENKENDDNDDKKCIIV